MVAVDNAGGNMLVRTVDDTPIELSAVVDCRGWKRTSWRRTQVEATSALQGMLSLRVTRRAGNVVESGVSLRFSRLEEGRIHLEGVVVSDTVTARLTRIPNDTYALYRVSWR